jgi:putative N-acetylmannosamine-6-phosphate epimerase
MDKESIIRMASECGLMMRDQPMHGVEELAKAAYAAGAAAERKRLSEEIHSCHANCDHPVCVAVRKEREACAKVCNWIEVGLRNPGMKLVASDCAAAIRARGQS